MGQVEDLALFVAVVQAGSVSQAAKDLGLAKSAVSRRLSLLEARFNTVLIARRPGHWAVTARGAELYDRAQQVVSVASALEDDFRDQRLAPQGPLRLSLPRDFGLSFLSGPLGEFADQHPGIDLRLSFEDRFVDLRHENFDAVIRISPHPPEGAQAQVLGTSQAYLCASPGYLRAAPPLHQPQDLENHTMLGYGLGQRHRLTFGGHEVELRSAHASNSGALLRTWALAGRGITMLPDFLVATDLATGTLQAVLPAYPLRHLHIYLCTPLNAAPNRRVTLFREFIGDVVTQIPIKSGPA